MSPSTRSWNPFSRWPWLWFAAGFGMMLAAWVVFFIIAAKNPTPDVRDKLPPAAQTNR